MRAIKMAEINPAHIVYTRDITLTRDGAEVTETVPYATGRTSKGNETHSVHPSVLGGLATFCGLDAHGRVHHTIWTVAKSPLTCEKCNGTKGRNQKVREYRQEIAKRFES